jgi:hypothetical protein
MRWLLSDITYFWSGEKNTFLTLLSSLKFLISVPFSIAHNFIVLSSLPDRANFPSGEKATELTSSECPE